MPRLMQSKTVSDNKLRVIQDNFKCDRACGHCCKMIVKLNNEDITRLENAGKQDFWDNDMLAGRALKHKDGYCIFHRFEGGRHSCTVYKDRPEICRKYPFFGNTLMECPVLGFDRELFEDKI